MAWTDERIALLKQYWAEGRPASQIAETLGEGLTRNAVIGKAHRLGLAARPSPLKSGGRSGSRTAARPANGEAAPPVAEPSDPAAPPSPPADPAGQPTPADGPAPAATPAGPSADAAATPAPATPALALAGAPAAAAPAAAARRATPRARGQRVTLLDLNDRICRWPIGHPDEPDFHFCGKPVSPGFPYCAEHCALAYQAQQPRGTRPPGPPRPFGPSLPRPR